MRAESSLDWAFLQLRHEAWLEPIPAPFGPGDTVIATLRDAAIEPDWQIHTARPHGARVLELDSGHSPFFTQQTVSARSTDSQDERGQGLEIPVDKFCWIAGFETVSGAGEDLHV